MKKYTNVEFINTKYGIYKSATDTITSFPSTIIANGQNISSYLIKGNMTSNNACGDKTANLWDFKQWLIDRSVTYTKEGDTYTFTTQQALHSQKLYFSETDIIVSISGLITAVTASSPKIHLVKADGTMARSNALTTEVSKRENISCAGLMLDWSASGEIKISSPMLNTGSTALPYEQYGYKIPISCGSNTDNIYISEPLRKSLDGSNLFDTIESNGTLTRRVDSNGDALETPTTESITVPTITTFEGSQVFNVDTTLKPSEVQLTYNGWHLYTDKKYTSGEWV